MKKIKKRLKSVLMISYIFPPINESGTARPQYFAKYLSKFGYWPIVLTRDINNNLSTDFETLKEIEGRCSIVRVSPWDNDDWTLWIRHKLAFISFISFLFGRGKYWIADAIGWRLGFRFREFIHWIGPGLKAGLRLVLKEKPEVIWATGPRWSTLRMGYWLSILTRRPLIADIRDPWTYGLLWKPDKKVFAKREKKWEKTVHSHAKKIIYTSPITENNVKNNFNNNVKNKILTITNGFSDEKIEPLRTISANKCLFCYLGKLDPDIRNPQLLFSALQEINKDTKLAEKIQIQIFSNNDWIKSEISKYGLEHIVKYCGFVSQKESLRYMLGADILVLLQTRGFDTISGKVFEYISSKKPILGIVSPEGGDAWALNNIQNCCITGNNDTNQIVSGIKLMIKKWELNEFQNNSQEIDKFNRLNITKMLALEFDKILKN